jgi:TrmH family RNA methyltransferase
VCWSSLDDAIADCGLRIAEWYGRAIRAATLPLTIRIPHSAIRNRVRGIMSITVVLHEPQDLVNIAHVVRALKNFGLRDLRLVNPREYDAYRVAGIAHQTQDVLARVAQFGRLADALADCVHVVGFTARGRTAKRNLQRPREAAGEILGQAEAGPTALLFGREDKGLPNEALDLCHRVVTIPTSPTYPSLNLAHAVVLMLYELAVTRGDDSRPFKAPRREGPPATAGDLERLFADVEAALRVIEFFKTRQAEGVMRTVREVIHRTPLDEREAKLVRAMAIEVVKYGERLARSRVHVDRQ